MAGTGGDSAKAAGIVTGAVLLYLAAAVVLLPLLAIFWMAEVLVRAVRRNPGH